MADAFIRAWRLADPSLSVVHRDVGLEPPPFVTEEWIAASFATSPRGARETAVLAASDQLIDELEVADILVVATPMYNYGMPAALKAWCDQVVRIGRTFSFDLARGDYPLAPLLTGKTLVLLTCCGEFGFEPGGANGGRGHLVPHLRTVSRYLGVETIEHIGIEYQEFGDSRFAASKESAFDALAPLARRLAGERTKLRHPSSLETPPCTNDTLSTQ